VAATATDPARTRRCERPRTEASARCYGKMVTLPGAWLASTGLDESNSGLLGTFGRHRGQDPWRMRQLEAVSLSVFTRADDEGPNGGAAASSEHSRQCSTWNVLWTGVEGLVSSG
jgi:hypothetical protein